MNKNYYYPAVFTRKEVGFSVSFPDLLGCYTQGDTIEEAYKMSTSAIDYTHKMKMVISYFRKPVPPMI